MPDKDTAAEAGAGAFRTTRWSVVLTARESSTPEAGRALEQLCRTYWKPLYFFVRRQGSTPADAQDIVQGLFASLLARDGLAKVDRGRGRFRSFLLVSLKNFAANERDRARAQKRGGQLSFVALEESETEAGLFAAPDLSPDQVYDQTWAVTLIEQAVCRLREEYGGAERARLLAAIEPYLSGDRGSAPYAEIAAGLGLGLSAVKMAVQRMRRRFGDLLRQAIAETVSRPEEVDDEIRALFATLRR